MVKNQGIDGKRIFDIVVSTAVLVLTLPMTLVAALGIKLASPGPIFYRAQRVGKDGTVFRMHKFRTMHVHEASEDLLITGPNDVRIFRFGNLLRQTKVDELPQFIDVLRGKMSVVGPRPEDPQIVEKHYTDLQKETLKVKPGVTSPAAVYYSTHADEHLDDEDVVGSYVNNLLARKLEAERDYINKASLGYDLQIVWRTFLFVVSAFFSHFAKLFGIAKA